MWKEEFSVVDWMICLIYSMRLELNSKLPSSLINRLPEYNRMNRIKTVVNQCHQQNKWMKIRNNTKSEECLMYVQSIIYYTYNTGQSSKIRLSSIATPITYCATGWINYASWSNKIVFTRFSYYSLLTDMLLGRFLMLRLTGEYVNMNNEEI